VSPSDYGEREQMAGYDVVIEKIRQTGKAAQRVADGVKVVQSSAAVPTGDAGMPGARCVGKLMTLHQTWLDRENSVQTSLVSHAADMSNAADSYASHEDNAARDLTAIPAPASGPRPS
jgi:hypothetical protein